MPRSIVLIEISPCYSAATAWGNRETGGGAGRGGGAPPDLQGRGHSRLSKGRIVKAGMVPAQM